MKYRYLKDQLEELKLINGYRQPRTLDSDGVNVREHQHYYLNFTSNDYLGLAGETDLQHAFFAKTELSRANWMSASSSRALTGTTSLHTALENTLAQSYQKNGALIFNSGYHANSGILPGLTSQQDLVLSDKLIHASLIDGLRLSKATVKQFAHNNMDDLEMLLQQNHRQYRQVWIATESLFSMNGDYAPLNRLVELKNQYSAFLYVDEAHAIGCVGLDGLGFAHKLGLTTEIDLLIGTFGKALAGYGGFVVANQLLIKAIINFSRTWLFSTALPPITVEWNHFIWDQLKNFQHQRDRLKLMTHRLKQGLRDQQLSYIGDSHIVPILCPGNTQVTALSKKLEKAGVLVMPIRSPTVDKGTERIRLSVTGAHTQEHIQKCLTALTTT